MSAFGKMLRDSARQDIGPVMEGSGISGVAYRAMLKSMLHGSAAAGDVAEASLPAVDAALRTVGNAGEAFLDPTRRMPGQAVADKAVDFLTTPTSLALVTLPGAAFLHNATNYDRHQGFMRHAAKAQSIGESPMTNNIRSFSKHAGLFSGGAGRAVGGGMEPISDLLKRMMMTTRDVDITDAVNARAPNFLGQLKPGETAYKGQELLEMARRAHGDDVHMNLNDGRIYQRVSELNKRNLYGGGAAMLGLAGAADLLAPTADVWGYKIQKGLTDSDDRTKLQDEALTGFVRSSSGGLGKVVSEMVGNAIGSAGHAAGNAALTFTQSAVFSRVMANDPMLSQATEADKALLIKAYGSMTRFAPDVATDEFAVKNYLREALMSANGPDYSTLGNLARVNQSLTGDR